MPELHGDEGELFARHHDRLLASIRRAVRTDRANVEDACSIAWLRVLRYQPGREGFYAYLWLTAYREALRLDARSRRVVSLEPSGGPDVLVGRRGNADLEFGAALEDIATAGLSARQARYVGLLAGGYSYREIAEAEGCTIRTVERHMLRGHAKLRAARAGTSLEELRAA